ncbi:tRNA (cytidine(34)-2'-O)-methyltransferase [Streptomyces sp. RB5]|uniref:tRNA (Cytidine(34)-2'-O)-methyltransferase n=1 Tax=Streptomyces smaragdinus TaxID=2585196 RepID=A0A7K0CGW8_9ACTN|nr:TrmH family RNA methyltransferase [Streptomyces smaragdinus]MQY12725.1 tRNA (cytidine(34)-2'-O)-methyltransferase [Streptomyces smaragdinus]
MPLQSATASWRALTRRADDAPVLLDGFHALKHALRFGADIPLALTTDRPRTLALAAELAPDLTPVLPALLTEVTPDELRALVPRPHPTEVAALAARPSRTANLAALRTRLAPVIVLEDPRNLGNIGAVIRLAAGFGAAGVITTGPADPWHPGAVRGAAGLHYATAVERLPLAGLPPGPLYALDPEGDDIRGVGLPDDALLAFGTERHGLSPGLRARADRLLALPMRPQVSSYNLATSVAMTLFHWGGPAVSGPS